MGMPTIVQKFESNPRTTIIFHVMHSFESRIHGGNQFRACCFFSEDFQSLALQERLENITTALQGDANHFLRTIAAPTHLLF